MAIAALKRLVKDMIDAMIDRSRVLSDFALRFLTRHDAYAMRILEDHAIVFHPGDTIGRRILHGGDFNRSDVAAVVSALRRHGRDPTGHTALEIGANIGTHTIYLLLDAGCRHVVAIEPDPENVALLRSNVALNQIDAKVTVVSKAASDATAELAFAVNPWNRGASSVAQARVAASDAALLRVCARRGDDILADLGVEPGDVGLVWMDVEGHEAAALRGLTDLLDAGRPPIFLEYTALENSADDRTFVEDRLFGLYAHVLLLGDGFRPIDRAGFRELSKKVDLLCV